MAVKGAQSKEQISKKILETFEGSFSYNGGKEIRIPWREDGSILQIKITLTAAKVPVEPEDGSVTPASVGVQKDGFPVSASVGDIASQWSNEAMNEPTEDEKKAIEALCNELGLIKE